MNSNKLSVFNFVDRASELEFQIKKLKSFFENQIKSCNDDDAKTILLESACTLDSMEAKLKSAKSSRLS